MTFVIVLLKATSSHISSLILMTLEPLGNSNNSLSYDEIMSPSQYTTVDTLSIFLTIW